MNPGDKIDGNGLIKGKFPFYFIRRDNRGDIMIGNITLSIIYFCSF